jgi:hypothetical protein
MYVPVPQAEGWGIEATAFVVGTALLTAAVLASIARTHLRTRPRGPHAAA